VVSQAQKEENPLHKYFEWDDAKAGAEYRIWQARQLIKVVVVMLPNATEPIQAYVSMQEDRVKGGGYHAITSVLSDGAQRKLLLRQALDDLKRLEQKYRQIDELAKVWKEIDKASKKHQK
jgi:hypothetical protein